MVSNHCGRAAATEEEDAGMAISLMDVGAISLTDVGDGRIPPKEASGEKIVAKGFWNFCLIDFGQGMPVYKSNELSQGLGLN
jgi:hypothetical protein